MLSVLAFSAALRGMHTIVMHSRCAWTSHRDSLTHIHYVCVCVCATNIRARIHVQLGLSLCPGVVTFTLTGGLANLRPWHHLRMCAADVLVFESAHEDLLAANVPTDDARARHAAAGPSDTGLRHEASWEAQWLAGYAARLKELMREWERCRRERAPRPWRPVFMLGAVPPSLATESGSKQHSLRTQRRAGDSLMCTGSVEGNSARGGGRSRRVGQSEPPTAHTMQAANTLARELVQDAGFEVYDPVGATLHASPRWWGDTISSSHPNAEPLADLLTQSLINQVCE